jgi:hypothetical protein
LIFKAEEPSFSQKVLFKIVASETNLELADSIHNAETAFKQI